METTDSTEATEGLQTAALEDESEEPLTPAETAQDFLLELLAAMESPSQVHVKTNEEGVIHLDIVGEDAGMLVGRHGGALNSLQFLTGLVVLHDTGEHARVMLDADGYRARREAALVEQAMSLAAEVARVGQEAELDPLSAFERRIIHNALVDHPDVVTYSEGAEPDRRVIIAPRNQSEEQAG